MSDLLVVDEANDLRGTCPVAVERPCMVHRWDRITFLHWRYPAEVVQALLPPGLRVETFDGSAWVGLIPFVMQVRPPRSGPVPWLSNFPETNVRTYATGPDGTTGVWFLSLDASRLPAVVTARTTYRLPYFWSKMSVEACPHGVRYESRRRWPQPAPVRSAVEVELGSPLDGHQLDDLDHWLTARWVLHSRFPRSLWFARADHPPWPLRQVALTHLDDELVTATGLPAPTGVPLVHHSDGVEVQISTPRRYPR